VTEAPEPLRTHGPWVDIHSHPGLCFLDGASGALGAADRLRRGSVTAAAFATVGDLGVLHIEPDGRVVTTRDFEPGEAEQQHTDQLQAIAALGGQTDLAEIRHPDDIVRLHADGQVGAWISCEGGDFVEHDPGRVQATHTIGARSITLVHFRPNELGDVQTSPEVHSGLSAVGREVVAEMNALGMIVDLAHATFATTLDAISVSSTPVMISHSHLASAGADHPRLLSADHARAVAESGGLIGAWPAGIVQATLADFADEIMRLVDLVGVAHVAVGSDMDANFRAAMGEYDQMPELDRLLAARGLDATERDGVLGANFIALWRRVLDV
jgi:membrane dipeptidase